MPKIQIQDAPRPTTIVFCLPGSSFSGLFLECWTDLVSNCISNGIRPLFNRKQSCNIYYVRNMCLGADVTRGENQKPFDGKLDYDYLMWIDSDIIFNPNQFMKLLSYKEDIVSGLYLMEDQKQFATVKVWDYAYFQEHGTFQFLTPADIADQKGLIEVSYTGMGFMLVKKGVFEKMPYPWFKPIEKRVGNMVDFTMEDVSFCLRAQELGYKIKIDPEIKVGHYKSHVII